VLHRPQLYFFATLMLSVQLWLIYTRLPSPEDLSLSLCSSSCLASLLAFSSSSTEDRPSGVYACVSSLFSIWTCAASPFPSIPCHFSTIAHQPTLAFRYHQPLSIHTHTILQEERWSSSHQRADRRSKGITHRCPRARRH
jgi:hypothetical protein